MSKGSRAITAAGLLPVLFILSGCMSAADDPSSPEFAALCSGAFSLYYVVGGKGPEYQAKSKKALQWRDRYYRLTGIDEKAAKKIIKINMNLSESHRGQSTQEKNNIYKQMQDVCSSHEV